MVARSRPLRVPKTRLYKTGPERKPALAGGGSCLGLRRAGFVDDGGADEVAPLGPRAVVVADIAETQQIFQHEPGVRATFADSAVGDHCIFAVDALGLLELFQL